MSTEQPPVPAAEPRAMAWGSDAIAELLRTLDVPFIALNPGSSYRGLHDSLVNYLGNERPAIVLCLHEEHAVAIAHGYAKVTERPMAVALHSNVGLMHASMALFNAFCDRVPMLVLGATGPLDAEARRPWIDWLHTAADQGAQVRQYVKWDDQPGSVAAALESLARGAMLTATHPRAPVYVSLDVRLQEDPIEAPVTMPRIERHRPLPAPPPSADDVARVAELLAGAQRPLILVGRVGRGRDAWNARVRIAERWQAAILTDLKVGAGFPSKHPLAAVAPGTFLTREGSALVRAADVIVSLDWVDLGGTLRHACSRDEIGARIVSCTTDHVLHNGWSKDHFALAPVDLAIQSHPDLLVHALSDLAGAPVPARADWPPRRAADAVRTAHGSREIRMPDLAVALSRALAGCSTCLVRLPLSWSGSDLDVSGPLDYLGGDGGAGLASGPGLVVGAALGLRGTERLAVAVLGDGDYLMGAAALWTAAHLGLALLVVVANNRSYFNDEMHQERIARRRSRPIENRWVGQRIADPDPDLAVLARSLGLAGEGPVTDLSELDGTLKRAVARARAGAAVVVDVRVIAEADATGAR